MSCILKSEGFALALRLRVFEEDMSHPVNATMKVEVQSEGYSGQADMDIDVRAFVSFAADCNALYGKLHGTAEICESFGDMKLTFRGDGRGYIHVSGQLSDGWNALTFRNAVDQTSMRDFCVQLNAACEACPTK